MVALLSSNAVMMRTTDIKLILLIAACLQQDTREITDHKLRLGIGRVRLT